MIKILDNNFVRVAAIKNVLDATRLEELNGENTLDFSAIFDGRVSEFVTEDTIYELDDDYFDTAVFKKSVDDDGMITVNVETEHVSYRLNKPEYNVEYFTEIGLPSYILGKILEGTNFTVGTVEFTKSITYSAKESKSRRQLLMELVAYVGGEVDFNKFEVNILTHRGSTEVETVIKDRNVKVVSKTVNKRQKDKDGNDLVSYICTPMFIPGDSYALGDNIALVNNQIGLVEQLRAVSISHNPYDKKQTALQFANYTNGLENSLFRIETNTIAKGKLYYGARISPEMGFESIRSDLKARTVMNADTFAMQVGDGEGNWTSKLYFDPATNMYIFDGTLSATAIEAIKAEIDVVISNTTITNVISAQKGNIAELTVDQIDTSDMVQKYLNSDKGPVGYWRGFDQFIEFVKAEYAGDINGVENKIQVTNRTGDPLYWLDAEHIGTGITTDASSYPVWRYVYNGSDGLGLVALKMYHVPDPETGFSYPRIEFGAGNPSGRQKGYLYKDSDEFALTFTRASDGEEVGFSITDNGARQKGASTTVAAIRNIAIAANATDAQSRVSSMEAGDFLYLTTSVKSYSSGTTLNRLDPRIIRFTCPAEATFTMPTDAVLGDEFILKNYGLYTVNLIGTFDGDSSFQLLRTEALHVVYTGSSWDVLGYLQLPAV